MGLLLASWALIFLIIYMCLCDSPNMINNLKPNKENKERASLTAIIFFWLLVAVVIIGVLTG